jgi:hypothetical protein
MSNNPGHAASAGLAGGKKLLMGEDEDKYK